MYDLIESVHKALGIESTRVFVLVMALSAALIAGVVGGVFAWIVDVGYKKSPEYKAEHPPKPLAVTPNNSPAQSVTATAPQKAEVNKAPTPPAKPKTKIKNSPSINSPYCPNGIFPTSPNFGTQTVINEPPDREWKISTSQKSLLCGSPATARILAVDTQEAIRFSYKIADVLLHCGWHVPEIGTCQYAGTINGVWVQSNSADPSTQILLDSMDGDFPVRRSDFQEFAVGWVVINIGDHGAIQEGDTLPPCTMANITGGYRSDHASVTPHVVASSPVQDNSVHIGAGATVDQSSTGPCSPNMIGGSNTVNCGPPPPEIHVSLRRVAPDPRYGINNAMEFTLTTNQSMIGGRVLITCKNKIKRGEAIVIGGLMSLSPGGGMRGDNAYESGVSAPNWAPQYPLVVVLYFDEDDLGACTVKPL